MDDTPNLDLPYLMPAQAQKHVTHNEALRHLDTIVQLSVASKDLATPPANPTEGERFIIADGATDSWIGQEGTITAFQDGAWAFNQPKRGWTAWVEDQQRIETFDGSDWIDPSKVVPGDAHTLVQTIEEQLILYDESRVTVTQIPNRAIRNVHN